LPWTSRLSGVERAAAEVNTRVYISYVFVQTHVCEPSYAEETAAPNLSIPLEQSRPGRAYLGRGALTSVIDPTIMVS